MPKFYITFKIDARYIAEVEADSLEAAMMMAQEKFLDADLGEASDIDGRPMKAEDAAGRSVWEGKG